MAVKFRSVVIGLCVTLGIGVVTLVAFVGLVLVSASGLGGWTPNARSAPATRAYSIDRQLRKGMTREEVLALLNGDTYKNSGDKMVASLAGNRDRVWSDEADLYLDESRRYFWNSYDAMWIVRAGFDDRGYLVHHRVDVQRNNGP